MEKILLDFQALCAENQEIETMALRAITALFKLIGKSIQNDETEVSTKKLVDRAIRGKDILSIRMIFLIKSFVKNVRNFSKNWI